MTTATWREMIKGITQILDVASAINQNAVFPPAAAAALSEVIKRMAAGLDGVQVVPSDHNTSGIFVEKDAKGETWHIPANELKGLRG